MKAPSCGHLSGLSAAEIEQCFADTFARRYRVKLQGGASEPEYRPSTNGYHHLIYRENFPASALHEVAHWCIAGETRRKQVDFGYKYLPPPRSTRETLAFRDFERRPQALESVFAAAARVRFVVSADDLDLSPDAYQDFCVEVARSVPDTVAWIQSSSDRRAYDFLGALLACRHINSIAHESDAVSHWLATLSINPFPQSSAGRG